MLVFLSRMDFFLVSGSDLSMCDSYPFMQTYKGSFKKNGTQAACCF